MNEKAEQLKVRTAAFATAVVSLCEGITPSDASRIVTRQLIAAATSVAANYRAACRPQSRKDFVVKVAVARVEADETHGWLMLLVDLNLVARTDAAPLITEANELTAILNASYHTAKRRLKESPINQQVTKSPNQ